MPKTKEICQDCGKVFIGGPDAFFLQEVQIPQSRRRKNERKIET